jgi:hypothetical protein
MAPRLSLLLLRAICSTQDWPGVIAELEVEYETIVLPEHGPSAARRWFWSQTLRSARELLLVELRRADWEYVALFLLLASAGPSLPLDAWWGWLLSLIPCKAGLIRGGDFVTLSLVAQAVMAIVGGSLCSLRGLFAAIPAACLFSRLGHAAAQGIAPGWLQPAMLLILSAGLCAGAVTRRHLDRPQEGALHEVDQN